MATPPADVPPADVPPMGLMALVAYGPCDTSYAVDFDRAIIDFIMKARKNN